MKNVDAIMKLYDKIDNSQISTNKSRYNLPTFEDISKLVKEIKKLLLFDFNGKHEGEGGRHRFLERAENAYAVLKTCLRNAYAFEKERLNKGNVTEEFLDDICEKYFESLSDIRDLIEEDVSAGFDGDPAASSKEFVLALYPGVFATMIYRMANSLAKLGVPFLPRMMTEYSHSRTGIDIHPKAEIGKRFFIDHGTGVVIGETAIIGDNVKIYQGVTLGALSTAKGQLLSGLKRHPTIEDGVTIYSNATILGGETIIGEGSIIGGNTFITRSVEKKSRVRLCGTNNCYDKN